MLQELSLLRCSSDVVIPSRSYYVKPTVEMGVTLFEIIYLLTAVVSVSSLSITTPGDVIAGRPFTLECKITRPTGDIYRTAWFYSYIQNPRQIYSSRECTPSIPVLRESPAGLSGGCQHVNGEEVYTVTIQNVTEDTGRVTWICQNKGQNINVTLDVKVPVTRLTLTNLPDTVLAGKPTKVTCVTSASKPQACIRAYIGRSGNVRELGPSACNQNSSLVQATTRTLTFTASAEENRAELYCNASNSVTDPPVRSEVYTINVEFRPLFPRQSSQQAAALGENVKLMFKFVSNPAYVNLTWYKLLSGTAEKLTVSNSSGSKYRSRVTDAIHEFLFNKAKVQLSGHVAELEISDVQRDDFGKYKFVVENEVGSSETIMSFNLMGTGNPMLVPLAGGISGASVLLGVVVLVVVIFRRRQQESRSSGETEKMRPDDVSSGVQSTRHYENVTGTESPANEHETTASVGHTGAYEDVDLIPNSSPSGPPVYAEVNKPETAPTPTKEQAPPVYAEVNKPKKTGQTAKAPEGPVYAEVNKTREKANEETGTLRKAKGIFKTKPGKSKGKPTPANKTGVINGKKKDGNGKTTVDTFANAAFTGYSNSGEVERMEPSGRPGQIKGPHNLVYADTDFVGTQPIMHPAENPITYASIAFGQVGPPVEYDNDEEDGHSNSS